MDKFYKVVKVGRISQRRSIIKRGVFETEAKSIVASYPSSSRSMVYYIAM